MPTSGCNWASDLVSCCLLSSLHPIFTCEKVVTYVRNDGLNLIDRMDLEGAYTSFKNEQENRDMNSASINNLAHTATRVVLLLALAAVVTGCATTREWVDPRDPLEDYNRVIYDFNDLVDQSLLKPVAEGYQKVVPAPMDRGVTNFFANLDDVNSALNNMLQFKLERAATGVARVVVNTTVGILGLIDVASNLNLQRYNEDFGQTFGSWGFEPGPYFVLPLLGPSSIRDTVGLVGDWYANPLITVKPLSVEWGLVALKTVDRRSDLLGASRVLREAALDPYEFTRDAFLQKRLYDIYDGQPPDEMDETDEFE